MEEGKTLDLYVEDKKVVKVETTSEETPLKDPIFLVKFEDGSEMKMTSRKFQAVQTIEKSDATTARETLVKELGARIYSLMLEYGLKFSEIDPTLNEVVRLVNDNQNHANDILWGNEMYDRSLVDVNRVLFTKYGEQTETSEDPDGATSEGGTPDTEDTK